MAAENEDELLAYDESDDEVCAGTIEHFINQTQATEPSLECCHYRRTPLD
jgi:hypothetical protein